MDLSSWILTLGIISGQIIKLPIFQNSGITMLDIAVLGLCCFGLFRLKFKLKKPFLSLTGALIFISVATLSLIFTPLHLTPIQFLLSFLYTIRFSAYVLLGWEIYSGAYPLLKDTIPQVLIASGFSLAILGLAQFIFLPDLRFLAQYGWDPHFYRTTSTFLDPNFIGAFFVLTLILITSLSKSSFLPRWQSISLFILVFLALLTTFSRSSYLMFLVSGLTFSFLKKSINLAFLTIILFLILLFSFQFQVQFVNKITPLNREETANLRFSTWQQGFEIFLKNPILGVGYNAYNFALRHYKLGDEYFLEGKGSTTNDSSLLYILSTTGILGIFAYFLFILGIINSKNHYLIAGIIGLLVHSFFVNSLFYPFILIWIVLSLNISYVKPNLK